jgi:dephospho-CoA kinase
VGRWPTKYVIGLTGNIAMGKSTIRKMLEHLGAYTIDADGLAHQVMVPDAPAYRPVIDWFGRWIVGADGKIDRAKLGAVAFSHPEALSRLEAITHPIVGQGIDTLIRRASQPVVVVEAIKLVDGFLAEQVDTIWVVDTAPQVQLERLMKRGMTEADARKRIASQNPQRDKLAKADVVISNNGTPQDAFVQVEREWRKILAARGLTIAQDQGVTVRIPARATQTTTMPVVPPMPPTPPASPAVASPSRATSSAAAVAPVPPMPAPAAPAPISPVPSSRPMTPAAATPAPNMPAAFAPTPATAVPAAPADTSISVTIKRGSYTTAEQIAQIINKFTGKTLTRMDVMTSFGQKAYLLAEMEGRIVGLAGFQVENLITRMDEFILLPGTPQLELAEALILAVEEKSKELQSEIGLMFLNTAAVPTVGNVFLKLEYQKMELDAIKVPAWREAAEESQPPNAALYAKKLRAERVLKPL